MKNRVATARDRITISGAMVLVAMATLTLASTENGSLPLLGLLPIALRLVLPFYYLVNLSRPKSAAEMAVAALAMVYFAWVAFLCYWIGGHPIYIFSELQATHDVSCYIGDRLGWKTPSREVWPQIVYWNWGLLAALYAAILLVEVVHRLGQRPVWVGLGGSPRRPKLPTPILVVIRGIPAVAGLELAGRLLENWLVRFLFGGVGRSGWYCPVEFTAWLLLAFSDWRPRPPYWRLSRYAGRVARLVPAGMAGVIISLSGTVSGWRCSVGSAACFLVMIAVYERSPLGRRHRRILALLLAMFWGFAVSAEIKFLPSCYPIRPLKRLVLGVGPVSTGNPPGSARSPNPVHRSVDQPNGRAVGPFSLDTP